MTQRLFLPLVVAAAVVFAVAPLLIAWAPY